MMRIDSMQIVDVQAHVRMINETLKEKFYQNADVAILEPMVEKELLAQKISSYSAAQKLLDAYFKSLKK